MEEVYREVFEGAMVCLICPTATAAAVITGKLGGSASSLTTYTSVSYTHLDVYKRQNAYLAAFNPLSFILILFSVRLESRQFPHGMICLPLSAL